MRPTRRCWHRRPGTSESCPVEAGPLALAPACALIACCSSCLCSLGLVFGLASGALCLAPAPAIAQPSTCNCSVAVLLLLLAFAACACSLRSRSHLCEAWHEAWHRVAAVSCGVGALLVLGRSLGCPGSAAQLEAGTKVSSVYYPNLLPAFPSAAQDCAHLGRVQRQGGRGELAAPQRCAGTGLGARWQAAGVQHAGRAHLPVGPA